MTTCLHLLRAGLRLSIKLQIIANGDGYDGGFKVT